jgi:DNA-binding protein HU-beta
MAKAKTAKAAPKVLTYGDMIEKLADVQESSKAQAKRDLEAIFGMIESHLMKGFTVRLGGIGTLTVNKRKARMVRNPRTGETRKAGPSKALRFKQSATMKAELNK